MDRRFVSRKRIPLDHFDTTSLGVASNAYQPPEDKARPRLKISLSSPKNLGMEDDDYVAKTQFQKYMDYQRSQAGPITNINHNQITININQYPSDYATSVQNVKKFNESLKQSRLKPMLSLGKKPIKQHTKALASRLTENLERSKMRQPPKKTCEDDCQGCTICSQGYSTGKFRSLESEEAQQESRERAKRELRNFKLMKAFHAQPYRSGLHVTSDMAYPEASSTKSVSRFRSKDPESEQQFESIQELLKSMKIVPKMTLKIPQIDQRLSDFSKMMNSSRETSLNPSSKRTPKGTGGLHKESKKQLSAQLARLKHNQSEASRKVYEIKQTMQKQYQIGKNYRPGKKKLSSIRAKEADTHLSDHDNPLEEPTIQDDKAEPALDFRAGESLNIQLKMSQIKRVPSSHTTTNFPSGRSMTKPRARQPSRTRRRIKSKIVDLPKIRQANNNNDIASQLESLPYASKYTIPTQQKNLRSASQIGTLSQGSSGHSEGQRLARGPSEVSRVSSSGGNSQIMLSSQYLINEIQKSINNLRKNTRQIKKKSSQPQLGSLQPPPHLSHVSSQVTKKIKWLNNLEAKDQLRPGKIKTTTGQNKIESPIDPWTPTGRSSKKSKSSNKQEAPSLVIEGKKAPEKQLTVISSRNNSHTITESLGNRQAHGSLHNSSSKISKASKISRANDSSLSIAKSDLTQPPKLTLPPKPHQIPKRAQEFLPDDDLDLQIYVKNEMEEVAASQSQISIQSQDHEELRCSTNTLWSKEDVSVGSSLPPHQLSSQIKIVKRRKKKKTGSNSPGMKSGSKKTSVPKLSMTKVSGSKKSGGSKDSQESMDVPISSADIHGQVRASSVLKDKISSLVALPQLSRQHLPSQSRYGSVDPIRKSTEQRLEPLPETQKKRNFFIDNSSYEPRDFRVRRSNLSMQSSSRSNLPSSRLNNNKKSKKEELNTSESCLPKIKIKKKPHPPPLQVTQLTQQQPKESVYLQSQVSSCRMKRDSDRVTRYSIRDRLKASYRSAKRSHQASELRRNTSENEL